MKFKERRVYRGMKMKFRGMTAGSYIYVCNFECFGHIVITLMRIMEPSQHLGRGYYFGNWSGPLENSRQNILLRLQNTIIRGVSGAF